MNSLLARLFTAFLLIILVVILIVGLALLLLLRQSPIIERQTLTRLNEAARLAFRQFPPPDFSTGPAAAASYVQQLADAFDARVLLVTEKNKVLADSQAASAAALEFNLRATRKDLTIPNARVGRARDAQLKLWLYVAYPLAGNRVLVFAAPQARLALLEYFGENLLAPLLEAGAVAALLAALLAILIARSIASPLQKMAASAQAIARGDYSQPAPVSGPAEVRALGQSLNTMAQEVQAAQQAQRDFVANVSHELKTPLTSIQGFAQAVLDGAAASPEAIQRAAGIIYTEADRLRRLVESLLDLARLDAGRSALHRAPLDLRLVLGVTVEKFGLAAKEKGITLQTDFPGSLPTLVGDADRLAQVFTNLLDNALQHTPVGGRVMLAAGLANSGVNVSVADSGEGILPEDRQRIFERFYQVDKSRARPAARSGVGLGLTISKEIIEAHGGALRVESVQGLGSKFTVWLPLILPGDETLARKKQGQETKR